MRKITVEIELYNDREVMLEVEHISLLILQGHTEGDGWKITGEAEKEKLEPNDTNDEDTDTSDIRKEPVTD